MRLLACSLLLCAAVGCADGARRPHETSAGSPAPQASPEGVLVVDLPQAAALAEDPATFILDVRTQAEYDRGHLKGATLIPVHQLADRAAELPADKGRPIMVHCQAGGRSTAAADLLSGLGYTRVRNFKGGFSAWSEGGRPAEYGPAK